MERNHGFSGRFPGTVNVNIGPVLRTSVDISNIVQEDVTHTLSYDRYVTVLSQNFDQSVNQFLIVT